MFWLHLFERPGAPMSLKRTGLYYVCLRLFERPGAPTLLKKHGSYLHAQVDFHTLNQKQKKNL